MTWQWYEWDSIDAFNAWHDAIKTTLGLPKPPINQASGEIDETAQWATEYTQTYAVNDKIIALVENAYCQDLIATNLRPIFRDYDSQS